MSELPPPAHAKATSAKTVFNYIDYPNICDTIPEAEFNADRTNIFIAFDRKHNKLSIEDRAFPLLRPSPPTTIPNPKPGFISFIGETGSGKSWIIRSLKREEDHLKYPSPLVAPGRQSNIFDSTSADVHLYADIATSESENPILFLDFEGLGGTSVPLSLKAHFGNAILVDHNRHGFIQDAYPRIAYAFSNCIIFVTKNLMDAPKLLKQYSNCGANGSRQLGFKPSLFVVFNKTRHDSPPSSWSVDETTKAFLAIKDANALVDHYHKIFVIHIPQLTPESCNIVIRQLDELGRLFREQHSEACDRRVAFSLDFSPDKITAYLTRSLRVFTDRKDAVFDWLEQSFDQRELPAFTNIAEDIWIHFYQYFRNSRKLSAVKVFQDALESFHTHFVFCVRLYLSRHPPVGRPVEILPHRFEDIIRHVEQVISTYVPCSGTKDDLHCDSIRKTHENDFHTRGTERWNGVFEHAVNYEQSLRDKVSTSLAANGSQDRSNLSVKHTRNVPILEEIRSVYSCVGCLNYPSTFLSCEHGFCEECVEEIAGKKDLHRLKSVKCPFCQNTPEEQHFSPRFLPRGAGYRILSLDGGGVRGIAQIRILRAVETRCFDIPIVHLFDFFIGTSIGGQIALALASRKSPLILSNAATEFRNLVTQGFKRKSILPSLLRAVVTGSTKYSATALETNLKRFFESPHLLSAQTPLTPHVAVTAASRIGFGKRVIPNYVRRPSSDKEKDRLVLSPKPEQCIPTWAAARCTAAAYPYFKAFQWNNEHLLDGAFAANCPAELAIDETLCIWPGRRMDVLLSVGTGATQASRATDRAPHPSYHSSHPDGPPLVTKNHAQDNLRKVTVTCIEQLTSSEKLWSEFEACHLSEKERIVRFQPMYDETFQLDAVDKLDIISNEVNNWLRLNTAVGQIDLASNQLIASLFFFKPSVFDSQARSQSGSIECRLPPYLLERQAMVNALIKVSHARQLFTVDIPGRGGPVEDISVALVNDSLVNVKPGAELSIPVTFGHLPLAGGTTIDIKLCSVFGNGYYSISGCPFSTPE